MLKIADEIGLHLVNCNMLPFKHALIYFGSDLGKQTLLVFHNSGHNMPGNIGREYRLKSVDLIENIVFDFLVLHRFRIFLDQNIKILNIIYDKQQRSDLKDFFVTVKKSTHHVIKFNLCIETVNHNLAVMHVNVLNLAGVDASTANQDFIFSVHA
jgi:hypothetical protein